MNSIYKVRMRKATGIPTLVLALVLASCGSMDNEEAAVDNSVPTEKTLDLFKVGVLPINPQPFSHRFSVQGNVETDRQGVKCSRDCIVSVEPRGRWGVAEIESFKRIRFHRTGC